MYPRTSKKSSPVHPRFGIVIRLAMIQMDHSSELSIHTSSSQGNAFGTRKQERESPSGVLLWSSPEMMAGASCHLWLFTKKKITPRIFTETSPVTGYSTTRRWVIWTGMNGWMKAISLFSRTCVASKINPHVLFFDGHDSHFDDKATHLSRSHNISLFILKAGDYTNDHKNDNGPNLKLKRYCGIAKVKWKRQNGNTKFTPAHMNSVLVDMWHSFQQQSASIIIDA